MLVAAFVLALWLAPSGVESRPMSGKFSDVIYSYNASEAGKVSYVTVCTSGLKNELYQLFTDGMK